MRILSAVLGLLAATVFCAGLPLDVTSARAGTTVRMEVSELARRADLIVEARVLSARAREVDGRIETEVLLAVERTFEGEEVAHRSVRLPGGVLPDGRGLVLAGMPSVAKGEDVLLFLSRPAVRGIRMPIGLSQGKFRIARGPDGQKLVLRDRGGLTLADPATGELARAEGLDVRSFAEVAAEIEVGLARKRSGR